MVNSRRDKRLAEDIAESVLGVMNVENRIRVRREGWGASTGTSEGSGTSSTALGAAAGTAGTIGTSGTTTGTTGSSTSAGIGRGRTGSGT